MDQAVRSSVIASAPTRLDFGGGWTDVPPFPEERGGFVCNLAISRRATVLLQTVDQGDVSRDNEGDEPPLTAAAKRWATRILGERRRTTATLSSDYPVGAGLGGSSAAGVALVAAFATLAGRDMDMTALAQCSRAVEVEELGIAGGWQDHFAAAYGGALGLTFNRITHVERIPLSASMVQSLESRCIVLYTGESRISGDTISAVLNAYRDREPSVVAALDRMKELARQMRDALARDTVDELGALVGEHWVHQRALHAGISTARIDALEAAARGAGAIGMKALGASGGGCVIVFAPADDTGRVADAIAPFGERLHWRVSADGVRVRKPLDDASTNDAPVADAQS